MSKNIGTQLYQVIGLHKLYQRKNFLCHMVSQVSDGEYHLRKGIVSNRQVIFLDELIHRGLTPELQQVRGELYSLINNDSVLIDVKNVNDCGTLRPSYNRTLVTKEPTNSKFYPVWGQIVNDKLLLKELAVPRTFDLMMQERMIPINNIDKKTLLGGTQLANLGVSAAITLSFNNRKFALTVSQARTETEDIVLKLISGYKVSTQTLPQAILEELSEELWGIENNQVATLLLKRQNYIPQYVKSTQIPLHNHPNGYGYINPFNNSAQYLEHFSLELTNSNWTLDHAEDTFNKRTKQLHTKYIPRGIVLLQLTEDLLLTGHAFTLFNGQLKPLRQKLLLSEAFCSNKDFIVQSPNQLVFTS